MLRPIAKMRFTVVCIWLLCLVNLYQGVTIVTVPSTVIQGQSASITCSGASTAILIKRNINIIVCILSQPVCSINDGDEFNTYRNDYNITHNSTSLTVTITNVSRNRDGGVWGCSSIFGASNYTVDVKDLPVVHIEPTTSPYKTIKGKQLNLTCVFDEANPLPDQSTGFTWSKNNVTIQGQRLSVYRVESVDRSHTGSYRCTGDNGVGTGTSTPVQVDVLFPPIVSTPSVYKVVELTDISLQCTATANSGDITYRWTGPGNLNTTGPWLNISNISKDRSGVYTCTATNIMKPTSSSSETGRGQNKTRIDVLFGPTVTISPNTSSIKIQENTTLRLNCTVQSNPLPTSVKWYKPDGTSIDVSSDGQLVITSIKRNQNGLYRCEANMTLEPSNGGSISTSYSKTVDIAVQYLDVVTINRKRLEVSEGQEVNITCSTDSNPVASIIWYNGTRSIRTIRSNTDSLIIDTATCLDTGVYICQAANSELPQVQFNQSASLFIDCSPRHDPRVDRISTVTGNIGDVVQLVADALVYPAPSFTWYYINTTTGGVIPIFNDGSFQHNVITTSVNTFRSTLNIKITSNIFYRTYAVNITNDVGSTDLMFEVKAQSVPDAPSNITYSQVGSHSICVDWSAGFNGGDQQKFIVQHSTDDKSWMESTPTSSSSYCIENLQPDTLYYIRVVARNRYGDSRPVYLRSLEGEVLQISTIKKDAPSSNGGLIAGIVIAVVVVVAIIVVLTIFILRKRRQEVADKTYAGLDLSTRHTDQSSTYQGLDNMGGATYDGQEVGGSNEVMYYNEKGREDESYENLRQYSRSDLSPTYGNSSSSTTNSNQQPSSSTNPDLSSSSTYTSLSREREINEEHNYQDLKQYENLKSLA